MTTFSQRLLTKLQLTGFETLINYSSVKILSIFARSIWSWSYYFIILKFQDLPNCFVLLLRHKIKSFSIPGYKLQMSLINYKIHETEDVKIFHSCYISLLESIVTFCLFFKKQRLVRRKLLGNTCTVVNAQTPTIDGYMHTYALFILISSYPSPWPQLHLFLFV